MPKRRNRKPDNRKELTIRLVPTVTGALEVTFKETTVSKSAGHKLSTAETTSDTFETVAAAIAASDTRIADFIDDIKENDPAIGSLFTETGRVDEPESAKEEAEKPAITEAT